MAGVTLNKVIKRYGDVQVIHGIDLEIKDGEFCVFVGPSGCGKSTLLRMVAGLEETTEGAMHIGSKDVTRMDPSQRGVAMVFQTYALYPHMTVYKNMAFGLKQAKTDPAEIDKRVKAAAEILQITDYLDRAPRNLSGGQRQRVAIGRAIVREPSAFLFDEPLSNLDAALRVGMRLEISELHKRLENTMIYVTHDQVEAMTMAEDRCFAGWCDRTGRVTTGSVQQTTQQIRGWFHRFTKNESGRRRSCQKTRLHNTRHAPRTHFTVARQR